MKQPLHILLLDDDGAQRGAFQAYVTEKHLPYTVSLAGSLCEARRLLLEREVDVVVSELYFADGDAFDLLQGTAPASRSGVSFEEDAAATVCRTQEGPPLTLPLILVTKAGSEATAVRALRAGIFDYIIKDADSRWLGLLPKSVEHAVRQHQAQRQFHMLTHALMSITDAVFITDTAQHIIFVNNSFCKTYGYSEGEVLGRHVSLLGTEVASKPDAAGESAVGETSRQSARELYHRRKGGEVFPVSLSRSVIHDEKGLNIAIVGVARDISAWKEAEARLTSSLNEKEVLLKEIHHRVKNNLQVVSSLLSLQSGFVKDEQTIDALRDSQNRVKSMALIHERLYQSESLDKINFGGYVQSLVNHVKSSFQGMGEIDVEVDVSDMFVDVDVAIPCGLIINELASNSFKHAFNGRAQQGRVHIWLSQQSTMQGEDELVLQVRDNGKGFPSGLDLDQVASLGLQLVNSLVQQLQGTIGLSSENGACSKVIIPLPGVDA